MDAEAMVLEIVDKCAKIFEVSPLRISVVFEVNAWHVRDSDDKHEGFHDGGYNWLEAFRLENLHAQVVAKYEAMKAAD